MENKVSIELTQEQLKQVRELLKLDSTEITVESTLGTFILDTKKTLKIDPDALYPILFGSHIRRLWLNNRTTRAFFALASEKGMLRNLEPNLYRLGWATLENIEGDACGTAAAVFYSCDSKEYVVFIDAEEEELVNPDDIENTDKSAEDWRCCSLAPEEKMTFYEVISRSFSYD